MARNGTSSSVIICFFLLMMVLLIPRGLTTRELAGVTPNDDANKLDNGHSKTGVRGSRSRHAGSATENGNAPTGGTVQVTPPTTATKVAFGRVTITSAPPIPPSGE